MSADVSSFSEIPELPIEGISVKDLPEEVLKSNLRYLHDEIRGYWALLFDAEEKLTAFSAYTTFLPTKDEKEAIRTLPDFPFPDEATTLARESTQVYIQAIKQWVVENVKQEDLLLVLSCPENQCHHFDSLPQLLEACRCPPLAEMVFSTYNFDDLIGIYVTLSATLSDVELPEEVKEEVRAAKKLKEEQKALLDSAAPEQAGPRSETGTGKGKK